MRFEKFCTQIIILLALAIFSESALAAELKAVVPPNSVEASYTNTVTASEYHSDGEQIDAHFYKKNIDLETYFENLNGQTGAENFQLLHLSEGIAFGDPASFQSRFRVGIAELNVKDQQSTQFFESEVELKKSFKQDLEIFAKFANAEFADLFQTQGAFDSRLSGEALKAGINWRESQRWRTQLYHQSFWFNDGNNRISDDLSQMYGISADWPWIWIGAGIENISDTSSRSLYWSPKEFIDYGPRIDIAFPLGEKLTAAMALNINHFKDIDFGEGNGYYFLGKLTYGEENHVKVDLSWEQIQSQQEANGWFSQAIRIGVICPF